MGDVMDVIGIAFSWPPGSNVGRWRYARLALAATAGVVDVPNFSRSESAIEDFYFVDPSDPMLDHAQAYRLPSSD